MTAMDASCFQVLKDSLNGKRPVDEKTFISAAVLSDRLKRLRKMDSAFEDVVFSAAVKRLISQKDTVAVG